MAEGEVEAEPVEKNFKSSGLKYNVEKRYEDKRLQSTELHSHAVQSELGVMRVGQLGIAQVEHFKKSVVNGLSTQ